MPFRAQGTLGRGVSYATDLGSQGKLLSGFGHNRRYPARVSFVFRVP